MNAADKIRSELREFLLDAEQRGLCLEIVDRLVDTDVNELRMLTYSSFSAMLHRPIHDPYLVLAVNFFANSSNFRLLDQNYLVVCGNDDDGEEISNDEVREAFLSGSLELPNGVETEDIESHLIPYFTASSCLLKIKENRCQM